MIEPNSPIQPNQSPRQQFKREIRGPFTAGTDFDDYAIKPFGVRRISTRVFYSACAVSFMAGILWGAFLAYLAWK